MLVNIDEADPGMILAEDVFDKSGRTLINSSSTLTENIIKTLKKYGITQINVTEESPTEDQSAEIEEVEDTQDTEEQESPTDSHKEPPEHEETPSKPPPEDGECTMPKISVLIENEGLSAYLRIESSGAPNERFTVEDLKNILLEENVVFGIKESLLEDAVKKWEESKEVLEIENIAQGIPPTPGKEGDLDILVKFVNNAKDVEKIKKTTYCWELDNSAIPIQRVDKGTEIARKELQIPVIPGKDVHGDDIKSEQIVKKEVKFDSDNVEEDTENDTYKSLITGLTYFVDGTLGVLPINFDGSAELSLASDNMKADLVIHRAMEGGNLPSEKSITGLFTEHNITFGIDNNLLSETLKNLNNGIYPQCPITIAQGTPPEDGEDGKVEYLFNTDTSLKPEVDASGIADYKNVNIIQSVNKDDEVAKLIPPTEGKSGKDIHGNEIPCNEGTPAVLPTGANTAAKPDDENVLIAQTDGNVRLNKQLVEIYEGFVLKGDVDYSTGNIDYNKSVSIGGDIKSSFSVKCGGDLEVNGTIEDAKLDVGGSVLGKYGFIGQGKGVIECKGDVNIAFMKNQTIRCRGNVNIAKEALNCTIFARRTITVNGKSLSIAGGTLIARDGITCNVVGNSSGIHTTLEVGLDFTLSEEMEKTEKQMAEILENKKKLLETLKRFERILQIKKKLPPKEEFLYAKLKNTITKYNTQVKSLEERKEKIKTKMHDTQKAFIKIGHSAMPGTLFKIGERYFSVHEEIIGPKTVRLVNYEIRII